MANEDYNLIIIAIYNEFNYIAKKFSMFQDYDSESSHRVNEIYVNRNKCHAYMRNEVNRTALEDFIKYQLPKELDIYKKEFNEKYASKYHLRNVFDIKESDLRNVMNHLLDEAQKYKKKAEEYIKENGSNNHFQYPVRLSKELISKIDNDVSKMNVKILELSSIRDNKKVVQGITMLDTDINEELFLFVDNCLELSIEWVTAIKSIYNALPSK